MTSCFLTIIDSIRRDAISKFNAKQDYRDVIDAIIVIDNMSHIARKDGLLALEEKYAQGNTGTIADDILYGVKLVVDGTEPDLVAEVTSNEYLTSKYEGNNALKQYILIRGILAIQEGMNPRIIEEILTSLLTAELKEQISKDLEYSREKRNNEYDKEILDKYENWCGVEIIDDELKELVSDVDSIFLKLNDSEMQRVLREIEFEYITKCLIYSSKDIRQKLLTNMSNRLNMLLIDDAFNIIRYLDLYLDSSKQAMRVILKKTQRLIDIGEILVM